MTQQQFIDKAAKLVQIYAPKYGIEVNSPAIAQCCLESAFGTSELAVNAFNFTGLKYKESIADGIYHKRGSEQRPDGSYVSSDMKWCKFNSFERGIEGYFKFINNSRYANLKGVKDPKRYLELIKADGYATSLKYVDNLMAVINKYDLTKYDNPSASTDTTSDAQKLYRVQVGAYKERKSAEQLLAKLKNNGFNGIIKEDKDYIRVQVGAYRNKANAEDMSYQLKKKGFDTFLTRS